jgi:hypothetical protein
VLRALKEDEDVVEASGKNVFAFKMQGFVLGAVIMGIGGSVFAYARGSIGPDSFTHFFATFLFWAMLIVGGSGSNWGAVAERSSSGVSEYQPATQRVRYARSAADARLLYPRLPHRRNARHYSAAETAGLIPEERRVSSGSIAECAGFSGAATAHGRGGP